MPAVSEEVIDAAMAAYGQTKSSRADRDRLRRAIEAAVSAAFYEGYCRGVEAAEYNDTNM